MGALNMSRMSANIDMELTQRGRQMLRFQGQGGGPPGGAPGQGPPPGQRQTPPRFGDEEADLIGSIRRPRWINPGGGVIGGSPDEQIFDRVGFDRALKSGPTFSEAVFRGEQIRVYSVPVVRDGRVVTVIQIARELRDFNDVRRIQRETLAIFLPLGLIAAGLVAWFLSGRVIRPIAEMGKATVAIGSGDLSKRLTISGEDEFAQLGQQFNQMADNVQGSISKLESTLEQQRRFTADASHELRTPLTRLLLATSSAMQGEEADLHSVVRVSNAAGHDMSQLVDQLLELAQLESSDIARKFERLDLRLPVSDAVTKVAAGRDIRVDLPQSPVHVQGMADLLERVFVNLVENAKRYSPSDSPVEVELKVSNGEAIAIVTDGGDGIPSEHLPKLTERFYRVDTARSREVGGTGLGLSIVNEIVNVHRGTLTFESEVGKGTSVTVKLPIDPP